jgi:TolA-binding protein
VQRKFKDAIQVFNELLSKHGDDPNISDAMLKKGFALIELGRHMEGREVLRKLISKYPFSEISSLAKQKLKEIAE